MPKKPASQRRGFGRSSRNKSSHSESGVAGLSRLTLAQQLEDLLRADIVRGALAPGQRLTVSDVSRRYRLSPTPAREALARLAGEGFIELHAQSSAQIAPVSVDELRDLYETRLLLEPEALAQSIQRADELWEESLSTARVQLRAASRGLSDAADEGGHAISRWSEAHRVFHLALFGHSGSPVLQRIISNLYQHSERYRLLSMKTPSMRRSFDEHDAICSASLARDAERAKRLLRLHLEGTVRLLTEAGSLKPEATFLGEAPGDRTIDSTSQRLDPVKASVVRGGRGT